MLRVRPVPPVSPLRFNVTSSGANSATPARTFKLAPLPRAIAPLERERERVTRAESRESRRPCRTRFVLAGTAEIRPVCFFRPSVRDV